MGFSPLNRVQLYLSQLHVLGIAGYCAVPPPLLGISQNYFFGGGGVRGFWGRGIAGQCCPLCYRALYGGIAAKLSQIAVEWVTKSTLSDHSLSLSLSLSY